jgi:hypothetical protein
VVTLYDAAYAPLARVTLPPMRAFCARQGLELLICRDLPRPDWPASWNKITVLIQHLALNPEDRLLWLDIDVVVVNPAFDLTPHFPVNGIAFSTDENGLCAGAFLVHGQWGLELLRTVEFLGEPKGAKKWEQDTFKELVPRFPSVRAHISTIGQEVMQCPVSPFHPEPFAVHLWAHGWDIPACTQAALGVRERWSREMQPVIAQRAPGI